MKCFWLLNHACNESQEKELREEYGVTEIIYPDNVMADLWQNLRPEKDFHEDIASSIVERIGTVDIAVVQGESTYSFYVVASLMHKGIKVLASVSERVATESRIGNEVKITRYFVHKCFREYHVPKVCFSLLRTE